MARLLGLGSLWIGCVVVLSGCLAIDDFDKYEAQDADSGVDEGSSGKGSGGGAGKGSAGKGGGNDDTDAAVGPGEDAATGGDVDANTPIDAPIASCSEPLDACGGDIVGEWGVLSSCVVIPSAPVPNCPGGEVSVSNAHLFGTITFADDDTYSALYTNTQTLETYVPKTCLGAGVTCADLAEAGDEPFTDTGDACVQTQTINEDSTETGTFSTSGSTLTMIDDVSGLAGAPVEYCVKNGYLTERQVSTDGSGIEVNFVAKKQ